LRTSRPAVAPPEARQHRVHREVPVNEVAVAQAEQRQRAELVERRRVPLHDVGPHRLPSRSPSSQHRDEALVVPVTLHEVRDDAPNLRPNAGNFSSNSPHACATKTDSPTESEPPQSCPPCSPSATSCAADRRSGGSSAQRPDAPVRLGGRESG
jgi:hypothetical protein